MTKRRLILAVVLAPLLGTLAFCLVAFGSLYVAGIRYSDEQIMTAAVIFAATWYLILARWAFKLWPKRPH